MAIKLVAIDMDGTLLNNERVIPQRNISIIQKLVKEGIKIVFSTGRTMESALSYGASICIEPMVIGSNGGIIAYEDNIETIDMNKYDIFQFAKIAEKLGLQYVLITSKKSYYYKSLDKYHQFYHDNYMVMHSYILDKVLFNSIDEIKNDLNNDHIVKMDIIDPETKNLDEYIKFIDPCKYNLVRPEDDYIEITHKNVSKGNGVNKIANYYNIKKEEIMTIGDSENDISMFEVAGTSICMGNAKVHVKEKASYVTDTNENCGVAKAILKYL